MPTNPQSVSQLNTDPNATQRGINAKLLAAQARYHEAQAAYNADPSVANRAALLDAAEKLSKVRSVPMKSLAPFAPKRYMALNEGDVS